jgi:hypothetical protein
MVAGLAMGLVVNTAGTSLLGYMVAATLRSRRFCGDLQGMLSLGHSVIVKHKNNLLCSLLYHILLCNSDLAIFSKVNQVLTNCNAM